MVTAEFTILGPPKFVRKGKTVRLHSAKATALLAYLVCRPEIVHSRETLATLLWGGFPEAKARQSLRQVLYSLRRALGEPAQTCLVIDSQTITFYPSLQFQVDCLDFERQIEAGQLQTAVKLYQGPLLEGVALDDCPAFEEWLFLARDRFVQRMSSALQGLVDESLAAGQVAQAIHFGQQFVALDTLNEGAYRRLMNAYTAQGDLDGMSRTYRQCRDILQLELGVQPAADTTTLYERLLSATVVSHAMPPAPTSAPILSFAYEGCEEEMARMDDLFDQAMAGQTSLVFVKGETGSGKSELVFEFWRRAERERPLTLLAGQAYETELGAPYVMWVEALAELNAAQWRSRLVGLPPVWRQELARLVPGMGVPLAAGMSTSSAENHLRFMQGIVQSVIHLAQDAPLLLFFDDLHWSDTASLELLHYAARQCRSHPILIVGSYSSDSAATLDRLQPFIDERRHPTIELSALRRRDIKAFLARLGLPKSAAITHRLYQHCQGNRLMLVEILRLLQESGSLDQLVAGDELPIPPRIQDLIETRLARLSEQQRRTLAAAAVIGRPFDISLLHQVSGQPELVLLDDIEALITRAFLEEGEDSSGQISFHHDFVRQVTFERLRHSQRRALHRRTADSLLAIHQSHPDLVIEEVASHYEQAGDVRALTYLLQAAEQAESFYALPQATQWLSRGLAFHERYLAGDEQGRFDILLTRENLLAQQGQHAARAADIDALLSLAQRMADPQRLAQATVRQAGYLSEMHQSQESKEAAEKALSLYRQVHDRHGEAQALRELGFICWSSNEYGFALVYGRQALQLHRRLGDLEGEASALHNLAEIHRGLNSPRQAVTFYEQALQLHWARQDHRRQCLSLYGMAHALRQLGRRQLALEKYQQTLAQADLAGDLVMASRVYHGMATLMTEMGDLDQAIISMQQATAISRGIGYAPGLAHSLIGLSYLYTRAQQPDQSRVALVEAAEWFRLMEDQASLQTVTDFLRQLDENPNKVEEPPAQMGWIKTYVTLDEGKVYCEYESPMAWATSIVDAQSLKN